MDELDQLAQEVGSMPEGDMPPPAPTPQPSDVMAELGTLSPEERDEAVQSLMQIIQIVEQLEADGASPEEIEQFLAELGLTLEELEILEQALMGGQEQNMMM